MTNTAEPTRSPRPIIRFLSAALVVLVALVALVGLVADGVLDSRGAAGRAAPGLEAVAGGFRFAVEIGHEAGWATSVATIAFLLIRRLPRHAGFVAVVWGGSVILGAAGPVLAFGPEGASAQGGGFFPEVLGFTTTIGVLLLVFRPVLSARARPWAAAGAGAVVAAFALLGVLTGVSTAAAAVVGAAAGCLWLAGCALAVRWAVASRRAATGREPAERRAAALRPTSAPSGPPLPRGRTTVGLVAVAALISTALTVLGLFLIQPSAGAQRFDAGVIDWFVTVRTPDLNAVARTVDAFGNTPGIIAIHLIALAVTLGAIRRGRPAVFLLVAVAGETAIYLGVAAIVDRARPAVDHAGMGLPPTSSFPSGHVAATVVTYGGIALLILAWSSVRWQRIAATTTAVALVLGVTTSRLYWGMHYPTDTLASVGYAVAWLAVCWVLLRPGPDRDPEPPGGAGAPTVHRVPAATPAPTLRAD